MPSAEHVQTDEELLNECRNNFYLCATLQGRVAYLLMSIHAVNPAIFARLCSYEPSAVLFSNMVYGISVHIFSRPHLSLVNAFHRLSFSILGSLMFNHASMLIYQWLVERLEHRPYLLTFLGFISGRIMMVHFLAYLYHVDTRSILGHNLRRDSTYETMYISN